MDADNHQRFEELLFQLPQLRKYVHAVNSAVGPELQDYQLAAQVSKADREVCVDPLEALRKLRCVDLACVLRCHAAVLSQWWLGRCVIADDQV